MSYQDIKLGRIQAHLDTLRQQEEDAQQELSQPDVHPWIRQQLKRLIERLSDERMTIEKAVADQSGEIEKAG